MVPIEPKPVVAKTGIKAIHPGLQTSNLCSLHFAIITYFMRLWGNFHMIFVLCFFKYLCHCIALIYYNRAISSVTVLDTKVFINCSFLSLPKYSVAGILHLTAFTQAGHSLLFTFAHLLCYILLSHLAISYLL